MSIKQKSIFTKSEFKKYYNPGGLDLSLVPAILDDIPNGDRTNSDIEPIDNTILTQNGDNLITQNNEYLSLQ